MIARLHGILGFTIALLTLCLSTPAAASLQTDENTTLHVYLVNNTNDQLHFDRIAFSKPGNAFTINPQVFNPGGTVTVTVENLAQNDIDAGVVFANKNGDEATLYILDQLQKHYGRPVFNVMGNNYYSAEISKIRNPNVGPRYLTYIEASLKIDKKSEPRPQGSAQMPEKR